MIGKLRAYSCAAFEKASRYLSRKQLRDYWIKSVKRSINNPKILTEKQKSEIKAYFAPYFNVDYGTHAYLYEKTGRYAVNYIPYYIHYTVIDPYFNDWDWAEKNANKCFQRRTFGLEKHEMPDTVCYCCNSIWFDNDDNIISYEDAISLIEKEPAVFIKPAENSCGGQGVVCLNAEKCGLEYEVEIQRCLGKYKVDVIVQRPVSQSAVIANINP